jgi:hypothetical protein
MKLIILAVLLIASPSFADDGKVFIHRGADRAEYVGCVRMYQDLHCFELKDLLNELGLVAVPKTKAAPKKKGTAPKASSKQKEL